MEKMPWRILEGKKIVGSLGSIIGEVVDLIFNDEDGKLVFIEVKPVEGSILDIEEGKNVLIPYKLVISIKDVVVINEELLEEEGIKTKVRVIE
ncbi:PRC-barrel domain-containing protein [Methanocaldococcus infernus]